MEPSLNPPQQTGNKAPLCWQITGITLFSTLWSVKARTGSLEVRGGGRSRIGPTEKGRRVENQRQLASSVEDTQNAPNIRAAALTQTKQTTNDSIDCRFWRSVPHHQHFVTPWFHFSCWFFFWCRRSERPASTSAPPGAAPSYPWQLCLLPLRPGN